MFHVIFYDLILISDSLENNSSSLYLNSNKLSNTALIFYLLVRKNRYIFEHMSNNNCWTLIINVGDLSITYKSQAEDYIVGLFPETFHNNIALLVYI